MVTLKAHILPHPDLQPPGCRGSGTKSVGQYTACFGVVRVPEPVLPGFTANVAPLLIKLADKRHISMGNRRRSYSLLRFFLI
ncbi:hypothetical protein BvCmsKSP081_05369 [Escherichia coli]|nr:hypothetical protein BvCmsKSP081_05369 [Escherichia coli]